MDLADHDLLTFDCYGTLIDWETGLLAALAPVYAAHGVPAPGDDDLAVFAEQEAGLEAGPYRHYRDVLAGCLDGLGRTRGFTPTAQERAAFGGSVAAWPAFPDSPGALARLHGRFRLGVITNCDEDLFAASAARLGVGFDHVVTAERARAYKPAHRGFELLFDECGVRRERILHVAQSLFHDHVPAAELGLTSVWIDRRAGRGGGATPPAQAAPAATFGDLASFAEAAV